MPWSWIPSVSPESAPLLRLDNLASATRRRCRLRLCLIAPWKVLTGVYFGRKVRLLEKLVEAPG